MNRMSRTNPMDFFRSFDDLTHTLGFGPRPTTAADLAPALGILVGGFVLGAVTALLLAPRPGAELRSAIGERVGDLRRRGRGESGESAPVLKEL